MTRLLCIVIGHRPASFAARQKGRHVMGTLCARCRRVLDIRAGSRQERRRVMRERVKA